MEPTFLNFSRPDPDTLLIGLAGDWKRGSKLPAASDVEKQIETAKDKHLLLKKESGISEQMNGSSYDALVTAMSNALEKLSRDIADGIRPILQEEPKKN